MVQTAVASVSINIWGSHVLVGTCVGPSVLLKVAHVEVEVEEVDVTATVQDDNQIRWTMMTRMDVCASLFGCCGRY